MQWYPVSVWELLFEVSLPVCICNIYTLPPFWKNNKNSVGRWSFPSDSWCHQKTINAQRNKGGHFTRQLSIKSNLNLFWKMSGGCLQSSACRCILRICWAHIFSHLCLVNFMKPWWDTTFFFFFLSFLVKVRGVWSVPLKTMVIFSLSSVGACISLQRPPEHVSSGGGPNCFDSTKFQ